VQAVKAQVSSTTISVATGNYANLSFLATAICGSQQNQVFTVSYTDGTTSTSTQSLSDWGKAQDFAGEYVAAAMAYRVTPSGGMQSGSWNLYAYSFALNPSKTVKGFTLPNNVSVVVLAVDLSAQ
jgi:alpha-mannosidase